MSKIVWLRSALDDILKIFDFLSEKNPEVAKKIVERIKISVQQLNHFPESGKLNEKGSRDFFVFWSANTYVLRYKIQSEKIIIIRVWHSKENRNI